METALLDRDNLRLLLSPERWRLIGEGLDPEAPRASDPAHRRWAARHTHGHANREILFVLKGRRTLGVAGKQYAVRPGVVVLFDHMTPHDLGYPADRVRGEHLWIVFVQDRCIMRLIEVGSGPNGHRQKWTLLWSLRDLGLASLDDLFPRPAEGLLRRAARVRCAAGVALLTAALVRRALQPETPAEPESFQHDVIAAIQRHIRENAGRGCRLESLARIAGYSKYHFLRIFRRQAGLPLRRYVDQCRDETYRRMSASGARLKTISAALGFAHPSAFTRWRKRMERGNPSRT